MNGAITIPDWNGDPVAFLYEFICGIDQKTWYLLICTFVAFAVVRVIINGIKHATVAIIIALVLFCGATYSAKVMKTVGMVTDEGHLFINNESLPFTTIKLSDIDGIVLSKRDGKAVVTIQMHEKKDKECVFDESYYTPIRTALKKLDFENVVIE